MPTIKVGTLVRLSTTYLESRQADDDLASVVGIVRFIKVSHARSPLHPPRATVQWNDPGMFLLEKIPVKHLEIWHGVLSQETREEFGLP